MTFCQYIKKQDIGKMSLVAKVSKRTAKVDLSKPFYMFRDFVHRYNHGLSYATTQRKCVTIPGNKLIPD